MDNFFYFMMGFLISYLILRKPIRFTVRHEYKYYDEPKPDIDLEKLEEKMLKEDPKMDVAYDKFSENMDEVIKDVNNIMGGSDRA